MYETVWTVGVSLINTPFSFVARTSPRYTNMSLADVFHRVIAPTELENVRWTVIFRSAPPYIVAKDPCVDREGFSKNRMKPSGKDYCGHFHGELKVNCRFFGRSDRFSNSSKSMPLPGNQLFTPLSSETNFGELCSCP